MTDLRAVAASLPHMGSVYVGPVLEQLASEVPEGQAIAEVGCWLGAGTAWLALGAGRTPIHVYDRWRAKAREVQLAARFGVEIEEGQDTLPLVMATLRQFGASVRYRRGDIRRARWPGGDIGLYVDDASKGELVWRNSAAVFLPRVAVGGVAVLMDFHFRSEDPLAQVQYMNDRADRWSLIADRVGGTTCAIFRRMK